MEINEKTIETLKGIFGNFNGEEIVTFCHCFDPRLTRYDGIKIFEEKTGLSDISFFRDSRAGGIRELIDGGKQVKKSFMRCLDVPINKHGPSKRIDIIFIMQPHSDCSDYIQAHNFESPFAKKTTIWNACQEKIRQLADMRKAETFIRSYYQHLPHINLKFIYTYATLLDIDALNIRFNLLKIT